MASLKNFVRAVLIGLILLAVPSQPSSAEPLAEINIAVIRVSSATLTPSQPSTTIEIVADLPDSALGAASIEIAYDPTIVSLTACALDPEDLFDSGQCNAAFDSDGVNPDRLRFNLISLSGISGEATLSRLTFGIVENAMGSSDISIAILAFATPAGATLPVASSDGRISVHQPLATESTSSSALPDWSPNHLVDGDLASQWSSNGHAEHLASSEWAAVLLTERANIQQIRLYPRYNTAQQADGFPKDFVLLYSRNGYRGERELTCNPADPRFVDAGNWIPMSNFSGYAQPSGGWVTFNVNTLDADCVRILATQLTQDGYGNRYFQLSEFEVYQNNQLLAIEQAVVSTALPGWSPNHLVDGDLASQWSSNGHAEHLASSEWAAVLLATRSDIQQIRFHPRYNAAQQADGFPKDFVLLYSRNGYRGERELTCDPTDPRFVDAGNWIPISNFSGYAQPSGGWVTFNVNALDADCVRVLATQLTQDGYGNRYFQLSEFEVFVQDSIRKSPR